MSFNYTELEVDWYNNINAINFSQYISVCIDRAAEVAFNAIPSTRAVMIKKCLMGLQVSEPSPELFTAVMQSTAAVDEERIAPDASAVVFVEVFVRELLKHLTTLLRVTRKEVAWIPKRPGDGGTGDSDYQLTAIQQTAICLFCSWVCSFDNDIEFGAICPIDIKEFPYETVDVPHDAWQLIALQNITLDDTLRRTNGMCGKSTLMFYEKIKAMCL